MYFPDMENIIRPGGIQRNTGCVNDKDYHSWQGHFFPNFGFVFIVAFPEKDLNLVQFIAQKNIGLNLTLTCETTFVPCLTENVEYQNMGFGISKFWNLDIAMVISKY